MSKLRRLDQLLASLGYGSRKEARGLIWSGVVAVSGEPCDDEGTKVDPATVTVRGEPLELPHGLLIMLHKPVGYVCTHADGEGATIYELLPPRWQYRDPKVTSIGRLDKETSGLLLVTDRGELVQKFTSPKAAMDKVYEVTVETSMAENEGVLGAVFASGTLMLHGEQKPCLPARFEFVDPFHARLTLSEGRYHQVRRMFASQGYHVTTLHRSRFGPYELEDLEVGKWIEIEAP